jgi:hypothetical protein
MDLNIGIVQELSGIMLITFFTFYLKFNIIQKLNVVIKYNNLTKKVIQL